VEHLRQKQATGGEADLDVPPAVTARRLAAQLLAEPLTADSPRGRPAARRVEAVVEVVGRLLAIQAQDLRGLRLAIRSRTVGLTVADVDRAFAQGRLVVTWLNRGTLHLVRAEDYRWLHTLTAPRHETAIRRRLDDEGVSPAEAERGVTLIDKALADDGPLTRAQLRDRLAAAGVPTAGQALIYLLALASLRGQLIRGPMAGAEQAYARPVDWLGAAGRPGEGRPPLGRDDALAQLAVRYLASHGPADERDLATWAGLPLRDARDGLALAASRGQIERVDTRLADLPGRPLGLGGRAWDEVDLASLPPRLLGPFDPVLHGWARREWVTGAHRAVVTVNGIFRPTALVAGRSAATWTMPGGEVTLSPFAPLSPQVSDALQTEAADVRRFLAGSSS